jgi:adenosylcobinamide-phosphate synthase
MSVLLALAALLIEAIAGYSDRLVQTIGHPVTWMGRLIDALDRMLNRETWGHSGRRIAGTIALLLLIVVGGGIGFALERFLFVLPFGFFGVALAASTLIAQRSLHNHVADVAAALEHGGLCCGRAAVSRIVGRDPQALDEAGIARAAIESLAENFSDGIVAPVFWLAIGGLAGGAIYKAINTADSMIGYRTARHEDFGFAAARIDDLVNVPASRLAALLIVAGALATPGVSAAEAWRAMRRDAWRHRSHNAGYPEAAMAGALGLALAGPRIYGGVLIEDAFMGSGRREATIADIRAALRLYHRADAILVALVACIALLVIAIG